MNRTEAEQVLNVLNLVVNALVTPDPARKPPKQSRELIERGAVVEIPKVRTA